MSTWIKATIIFFGGLVLGALVGIFVVLNLGLQQKIEEPLVQISDEPTVENEKKNDNIDLEVKEQAQIKLPTK